MKYGLFLKQFLQQFSKFILRKFVFQKTSANVSIMLKQNTYSKMVALYGYLCFP